MKPDIARILELHQKGLFSRNDVFGFVAMELAEGGTPDDVAELPEWLQQQLFELADRVDKEPKGWSVVSSAGARDVSAEWQKLLVLMRQCRVS
jgi:hypothetical protein